MTAGRRRVEDASALTRLAIILAVGAILTACAGTAIGAGSRAAAERALCADAQPGVHCGPGNGRRTAGGGDKVSHAGWPAITGELLIADDAGRRVEATALSDELLGGHGDDILVGGGGSDVIWGDQHATGNGTRQHDVLRGGAGNDFIYPSHGLNTVYGGTGADTIRAYYGHGTIDCGAGRDVAQVRENGAYRLTGCEHVVHFCAHGSAPDGRCLRPGEPGAR